MDETFQVNSYPCGCALIGDTMIECLEHYEMGKLPLVERQFRGFLAEGMSVKAAANMADFAAVFMGYPTFAELGAEGFHSVHADIMALDAA
jgi:hypothetical protein